jgi:hypothetical protein
MQFYQLYEELVAEEERNRLICQDVLQALGEGRSPLVLTERNEHLDTLANRLSPEVQHLVVLRGGMRKKELEALPARLAAIPAGEARLILATGRYVGEGFDDARLDTLFLTLPVSWHGTIAQYVGRLHRLYDGKREVRVYDYADLNVPMLARMFDRRCHGYEAIGYTIELPGSAVPAGAGWPADVPLPVDPVWKSQYAASVRRLVRDGVDSPLANLFVHVAVPPPPNAEGADRARSATEAFLYRRLETLRETAGKFHLNAELPIPFDGWGRMEVDLLCEPSRLALELDGSQHLGDPDAYRSRRRGIARMLCFRRTAIGSSASWPKTSVRISIKFWMRSCEPYPIKAPESDSRLRGNDITARGVPRGRLLMGREQVLDLSDRQRGQSGQHVGEIFLRVQAAPSATDQGRVDHRAAAGALYAAGSGSSEYHGSATNRPVPEAHMTSPPQSVSVRRTASATNRPVASIDRSSNWGADMQTNVCATRDPLLIVP